MQGDWSYSEDDLEPLRNRLMIRRVNGSRLIDISATAHDRDEATAIVNQITDAYVKTVEEMQKFDISRLAQRLKLEIAAYEQEVDTQEKRIQKFRQEHQITSANSILAPVESRIELIEQEQINLQMQQLTLEAWLKQLKKLLSNKHKWNDDNWILPAIDSDTHISSLRGSIYQFQLEETQLARVYLPGHYKLQSIRAQIADLQARLRTQKHRLAQRFYQETLEQINATTRYEKSLASMLDQQRKLGVELTGLNQSFASMLPYPKMMRKLRDESVRQMWKIMLEADLKIPLITIVDKVRTPVKPIGRNKFHQATFILLLGILFSIVFVLLWDRLAMGSARHGISSLWDRLAMGSAVTSSGFRPIHMPTGVHPMSPWPGITWPNLTDMRRQTNIPPSTARSADQSIF